MLSSVCTHHVRGSVCEKMICPFSYLDKLETPFHIFLLLSFLLPLLFILAHELIFPALWVSRLGNAILFEHQWRYLCEQKVPGEYRCVESQECPYLYLQYVTLCYTGWNVNQRVKRKISTMAVNIELSQGHLPKSLYTLLFILLSLANYQGMPFYDIYYIPICISNHKLWNLVVKDCPIHWDFFLPPNSKGVILF